VQKRKRWDLKSPETKALVDEIVHGTFVKEGTMVAFPACFPGATAQIPADESHITALDASADGLVYGGTSGRKVHLFVAMFHGVTGLVFDLGWLEGSRRCEAVCCAKNGFVAAVNGPTGGRLIAGKYQPLPFDLIQEWGFSRPPLDDLGEAVQGEEIVHAVADGSGTKVIGTSRGHLFTYDLEGKAARVVAEMEATGEIVLGSSGHVYGADGKRSLWRYDPGSERLERRWIPLPTGSWGDGSPKWAKDAKSALLYAVDCQGRIFSFDGAKFSKELGRTQLAPVGAMAATFDGRLFGSCGSGISRLFCFDPREGSVRDLGVAVSVIERRRYGYQFGAAAVGRDGEIVLGEDDDLGHVWLYFPKILPR